MNYKTVDAYLKVSEPKAQRILKRVRSVVKKTVPEAVETISYQIPAFKLNGKILIYFAGWQKHIGIYPVPKGGSQSFRKKLTPFIKGKGTTQFLLDELVPYDLIKQIVLQRAKESQIKKKK